MLAWQASYHLSHIPKSFLALVILEIVFYLDLNPPICASHIAGMTRLHHHAQLID
jgi:hypothetical protein